MWRINYLPGDVVAAVDGRQEQVLLLVTTRQQLVLQPRRCINY